MDFEPAVSAFGVEILVSKRTPKSQRQVPDWGTSVLPGSTVTAYNKSTKNKGKAAASNLTAKVGAGAVGSLVGAAAIGVAAKRVPGLKALRNSSKILGLVVTADKKVGMAQGLGAGVVGGAAGGVAGSRNLHGIKEDKQYGYDNGKKKR